MDESNKATSLLDVHEACGYTYTPLQYPDSIRLLYLTPGDMDSPIQIHLAEFRLQENSPYEAVSYTWATEDGDCSLTSQITCDGARLWITKNCELALRYLRETGFERILWVDAICINQKDTNERGHQVGIMRDVYSKAVRVLIWLGEESKDCEATLSHPDDSISSSALERASSPPLSPKFSCEELGSYEGRRNHFQANISASESFLNFLEKMAEEIKQLWRTGEDLGSSTLYQELTSQIEEDFRDKSPGARSKLWSGLADIVNRRWWNRVWVVQEVVAAKSAFLILSKKCTDYEHFFLWYSLIAAEKTQRVRWVRYSFGLASDHLHAVLGARKADLRPGHIAFFEVIHRASHLRASDPRDIVFGVLGLSDKFKTLVPSPDYNKSTTEIFTEVAKSLISMTKSLAVLEHATSTTPVIDHPSWVPYWPNRSLYYFGTEPPYRASKTTCAIFEFSPDSRELRVKGKLFDRVEELKLAALQAYAVRSTFAKRVEGYRMSCDTGFSLMRYPTGESVEEAVWRSLCWNEVNLLGCYPAPDERVHSFREWYRALMSSNQAAAIGKELYTKEGSFSEVVKNFPLCVTASGYLAAVPYTTQAGDCIALLAGGSFPLFFDRFETTST